MIGKGRLKPSYTQRPGYFAGILGMMAAIAGTLLVMGFVGTKDAIAMRQLEDLQASLSQVLPAELYDRPPSGEWLDLDLGDSETKRFYRALIEQQANAVAFEVSEPGYAGPIRVLLGVRSDGTLLGVRVLSHTETPGLGDKIELQRGDWILGFNGLSLDNLTASQWAVKKDGGHFDQFSGATITPRAVVKAVKRGLLIQRQQRDALNHVAAPALAQTDPAPTTTKPAEE